MGQLPGARKWSPQLEKALPLQLPPFFYQFACFLKTFFGECNLFSRSILLEWCGLLLVSISIWMVLFGLIQFVTGQFERWVPPSPPQAAIKVP